MPVSVPSGTYGLSGSGLDVDSMVKKLMQAQQASYDKIWQKQQQTTWKKEGYTSVYKLIDDFRTNTLFDFKRQGTLEPKLAASSNDSVVTATANADAGNVTHSITVSQLADSAKMTSSATISVGTDKTNLNTQLGLDTATTYTLNISDGTNSAAVSVTGADTIYDLVQKINTATSNNTSLNIRANYDASLDRFFLYSTKTGSSAKIDLTGTDATGQTLISKLKVNGTTAVTGADAKFNLDGTDLVQSSNNFTISGVTYNLKNTTASSVNISITPDIDKTVTTVKNFVNAYNTIVKAVNTLVTEPKYSDYLPLTNDQKSAMKDADITAWTTKAKSGLLQNDDILSNMLDQFRSNFITPISGVVGKYNTASSIGISTGTSFDANGNMTGSLFDGGQMQVDEDKLRKALQSDPDVVYKIFGSTNDDSTKQGIGVKLYSTLQNVLDKISVQAGTPTNQSNDTQSSLAKQLADYTTRLSDFKDKMSAMQDRYYKQFDALETAMSQMNQQSSWLSSQLSKM